MFRKITTLAAALATTAMLAVVAIPADAATHMDPSGEDTTYTYEPSGTYTMESQIKDYETGDAGEYCQEQAEMANRWIALARYYEARGGSAAVKQYQLYAANTAGEANKEAGCTIHQPE